jgi:hypothetical protein
MPWRSHSSTSPATSASRAERADDPDLDLDEVVAMARTHLAGSEIPRHLELRHELAHTVAGRLQEARLWAPCSEGRTRGVN